MKITKKHRSRIEEGRGDVLFWDHQEDEIRYHDFDDAVEDFIDGLDCEDDSPEALRKQLASMPPIKITGYRHVTPNADEWADSILEMFLERLDEAYGNPDGDVHSPSDAMKTAALQFASCVIADFQVWLLEPVCTKEVNALEWVEENRPHWLEEKK